MSCYTVRLAADGLRSREVSVRDFAEASGRCRGFIDEHGLGSSDWAGGDVRDSDGAVVARVSYNGRVWPPGDWQPGRTPLWEP